MNVHDAIEQACSSVGIKPPRSHRIGQWVKTDTLTGKNGKGDGRVMVDEMKVVSWNWQTGIKDTVFLRDQATPSERRQFAQRRENDDQERREKAARAARIAGELIGASRLATHAYFVSKGFPEEQALVVSADHVEAIGGRYLLHGKSAIVMPAKIGGKITSAQLIWEDGTKKFIFGGETSGACHRVSSGSETWLCEGYATGLSIRAALHALSRSATVLCCFSASNVLAVSRQVQGRCFIAADNDKPQFDGQGTAEHYARLAEKPFTMPPEVGADFNDMHVRSGIFAVQRHLASFIRGVRR